MIKTLVTFAWSFSAWARILSNLVLESSSCLDSFSKFFKVLMLSSRTLFSLSASSSALFLSSFNVFKFSAIFLFSSAWSSLFFSISLLEAMREEISASLLSHILFKVVFSRTVSSIWTVTLWICILRLSTSFLNSVRFFFDISIFTLHQGQSYLCSFSDLSFSSSMRAYLDSMFATSSLSLMKSCSKSLSSNNSLLRVEITWSLCWDSFSSYRSWLLQFLDIFYQKLILKSVDGKKEKTY